MKSDLVTNLIGKYDLCSVVHYKLAAFKKVSELMILYLVVDLLNPFLKEYQVFQMSYCQLYLNLLPLEFTFTHCRKIVDRHRIVRRSCRKANKM